MPHSHPEKEKKDESESLFKGIVMGTVIGVGVLWLLGSEEGKKLKRQITGEGSNLIKKALGEEEKEGDEDFSEEPLPKVKPRVTRARTPRVARLSATKTTPRRFFTKRK